MIQEISTKLKLSIAEASSSSGYLTCQDFIKWEMRLQHVVKDKDEENINNKKIIKSLTEKNMQLRRERESWKTIYHAKR